MSRAYILWLLREYGWLLMLEVQILSLMLCQIYLMAYVRLRTRQPKKKGLLRLLRRKDDKDDGNE